LPILGATGITVGGALIYLAYGRQRTDSTSALGEILERRRDDRDLSTPADDD
jgi:APA family basic amino acid/polyamine antiporter